jgi:hypothetical protein
VQLIEKSKKKAIEKDKSKGVLANARVIAKKAEAAAAAKKGKRKASASD